MLRVVREANNPFSLNPIQHKKMNILDTINKWLVDILGEQHFAVDVQFVQRKPTSKLLILLDGDAGVGIDKCVEVSRALSELIDEADLIPNAYTLEVSSPGVDRPLTALRQYPQHIGRTLRLEIDADNEKEMEIVQGKLLSVQTDTLQIEISKKKKTAETADIAFSTIKKATVVVEF